MRVVIQRVKEAAVHVNEETVGRINNGLLVFVGIEENDQQEDIEWLCKKIARLRIFDDGEGQMNLSVQDVGGDVLVVSQFTLYASTKKGNRPSFLRSANPDRAQKWYHEFIDELQSHIKTPIQTGEFGAMMEVELVNDGPVTILIDTKNKE